MMLSRWVLLSVLVACGSQRVAQRPCPAPPPPPTTTIAAPQPAARPVAIAFVFQGWEMWIGNDHLADIPDQERYPGVLRSFKEEFAGLPLTGFAAGSQAAVITYTDRAQVRHPMGPIEKLDAAAFGEQQDYSGVIDRSLVDGVELGVSELAKVVGARRILVVIGDGSDTNDGTAKTRLAALAKRAAAEQVEVLALVYKGALSQPQTPIVALDPHASNVSSADAIATQLGWSFARWKQRPIAPDATAEDPVTVVLLVSGSEIWMGNDDTVPPNDPSRYVGALGAIRGALDKVPKTGFPAGSQVMIVTYDSRAQVRMPMLPIENLDARAVGRQRDYRGRLGDELVSGVRLALIELAKVQHGRRVLIALGDGADTNNETAKLQLHELAGQAAEIHIEIHAVVYKTALSGEATVVTELDPNAATVTSTDAVARELGSMFQWLRKH